MLDPFTALNRGASSFLGLSLGNYQLMINIIILVVVFFMKRSLIGWGTIYNMVLIGCQVNFFHSIFGSYFTVEEMGLMVRSLIALIAIAIFALGVAIYMDIDLAFHLMMQSHRL